MNPRPVRAFLVAAVATVSLSACTTDAPKATPTEPTTTSKPTPPAATEPADGKPGSKTQKITSTPRQVATALLFLGAADEDPSPAGAIKFMAELAPADYFAKEFKTATVVKDGFRQVAVVRRSNKDRHVLRVPVTSHPSEIIGDDYDGFTLALAQITATDVKDIRENVPPLSPPLSK